jgi:hypothetical protein
MKNAGTAVRVLDVQALAPLPGLYEFVDSGTYLPRQVQRHAVPSSEILYVDP